MIIVHEAGPYTLRPVSASAQEWFKTNVNSTRPLTRDQVRVVVERLHAARLIRIQSVL